LKHRFSQAALHSALFFGRSIEDFELVIAQEMLPFRDKRL
jgi:hypothetical protein